MAHENLEFQEIYEDYMPQIVRYFSRLVGDVEAEDLAQETFVKVDRGLESFRGDSKLSTWIYSIATNVARDRFRKTSGSKEVSETSISENGIETEDGNIWTGEKTRDAEGQALRKEMNDCIRRFIDDLPEEYREVLILMDLEGFKQKEIAEILGISLDNVKIRLHRGRLALRGELQTGCSFHRDEENELGCELKSDE